MRQELSTGAAPMLWLGTRAGWNNDSMAKSRQAQACTKYVVRRGHVTVSGATAGNVLGGDTDHCVQRECNRHTPTDPR